MTEEKHIPTALKQLTTDIHRNNKCLIFYMITGVNGTCDCIGFKPINVKPTRFILFNVPIQWADILQGTFWKETIIKSGCEIMAIDSYVDVLRGKPGMDVEIITGLAR